MALDDRIPKILETYSVIDEFRKDYGSYIRGGSERRRAYCRCPFHEDRNPSMIIDESGFRCMSARCGVGGDIIDYIMLRDNCTKRDAIELLARGLNEARPAQPVRRVKHELVTVEMAYIQRFYANIDTAMPFFQTRAVTLESGHRHKLGSWTNFHWSYELSTGEVVHFESPRYSIPNIRRGYDRNGNPIAVGLGVNFRRDDAVALKILKTANREQMKRVGQDIANRFKVDLKDIKWEDMLDDCFGPKYWRKGSATRMFNSNVVVTPTTDGGYEPTRLSSVLVVEGEIDAMSLSEAGYNAVAVKYSHGLDLTKPLAGVAHIYIVKDRDKDFIRPDGTVGNGGRDNALLLYNHLKEMGRDNITIIEAPQGSKDANDVILSGGLKPWLMKYGLLPSSKERRELTASNLMH